MPRKNDKARTPPKPKRADVPKPDDAEEPRPDKPGRPPVSRSRASVRRGR